MQTVRQGNGESSEFLHGAVADPKEGQDQVEHLDSEGILVVLVIDQGSNDHRDGQQQLCDVIQRGVAIESKVVMAFLKKKVVIALHHEPLCVDDSGLPDLLHKLVVQL